MLKKLMDLAEGRIALVLEGGYNLDSIAKLMHACLEVLLEDKPLVGSSEAHPLESTWRVIQAVRKELSPFWPTLASELTSQVAPPRAKNQKMEDLKKKLKEKPQKRGSKPAVTDHHAGSSTAVEDHDNGGCQPAAQSMAGLGVFNLMLSELQLITEAIQSGFRDVKEELTEIKAAIVKK